MGTGTLGKALLSLSVMALLGLTGCGKVGTSESPTASPNDGKGSGSPTNEAIGDPHSVAANNAVLTNTQTNLYNLDANQIGEGSWRATTLLENNSAKATSSRVVFDTAGNGFAIWTQGNDTIVRRYVASSAAWAAPVTLDTSTQVASQSRIAIDRASGNAVAIWSQSDGTAESLYAARYTASTNTWTAAELVENATGAVQTAEAVNVSMAGDQMAIAWRQIDAATSFINVYLSRFVSGAWTTPAIVDVGNNPALHPELATDVNGNVIVTYRMLDGDYGIFTRRWNNATQTFSSAMRMNTLGDRQSRIFMDASGNAWLLWRGGGIYVRHYNVSTNAWTAQTRVDDSSGDPRVGELAADPLGNAMVAWVQIDSTGTAFYTRRYSVSTGTWGAVELMENTTGDDSVDKNPAISIYGDEAVAAWLQIGDDARENVYAKKLTEGVWGPTTLLETRFELADELFTTINAAGNAGVQWLQADGVSPSVYHAAFLSSNFVVPNGATWQSVAFTLYGVNSAAAGSALQAALGGGALVPGTILNGLPPTLSVTTSIPGYYTVLATDTWAHIARTVYGVTDAAAITQLQNALGNPTLMPGVHLVVPTTLNYTESGHYSAPLNWSLVNTTTTTFHSLDTSALTVPLDSWAPAELLEETNARAYSPRVAYAANGNGLAVWVQGSDVLARRFVASTGLWSEPVVLDTNTNEAHQPRLALDRATGNAVVSWSQSDGAAESMYVSSYTASSNSWSAALLIETSNSAVSTNPDSSNIALAGANAAVTWVQSDGTSNSIYLSRLVAGTWTAATQLDTRTEAAEQPVVAVDSNGNVTVGWRQMFSDNVRHIFTRRWDNTALAYGSVMQMDIEGGREPRIGFDSNGNGFLLWGGGAFVRRFDTVSGWGAITQLHSAGGAWSGSLAVDASGDALAVWIASNGTSNSVYTRYFTATAGTWGAATLIEDNAAAASIDVPLTVALVNGSGVVAWVQENPGQADIYASRFDHGVWGPDAPLESRTETPSELTAGIGSNNKAIVLWVQADGAAPSVYQALSDATPYYLVTSGATWRSIANALYHVDSDAAGSALQTAMLNPTLTAGLHLVSPPATLAVSPSVPTYYIVQAGDTWASITLALYGTSATQAVTALQTAMGNPALTAGTHLEIPSALNYFVP